MRALLAGNRPGLVEFGRNLTELGWELIATSGSHRALSEAGVAVQAIADLTGSPEMLGGRVRTLHPMIHGGILYRRGLDEDEREVAEHEIPAIDLVACNIYPFIETVQGGDADPAEAIEQIDIGGPAMIRAAAKNHEHVIVVVDPDDYDPVIEALQGLNGPVGVTADERRRLAAKAFRLVAHYDSAVAGYLTGEDERFPERLTAGMTRREELRYGENPHQAGAFYVHDSAGVPVEGIGGYEQHHGKGMSYVNVLDADAAYNLVCEFDEPAVAIIKHTNPACLATAARGELAALYERALTEGDYLSAYGGIVACNRPVDLAYATALRDVRNPETGARMLYDIVIAPSYEPDALEHLKKKSKDLRIVEAPAGDPFRPRIEFRSVRGGMLVQQSDVSRDATFDVVSERLPTDTELADLKIAWTACKHVKSNAVAFVHDGVLVGMGAGQPNRVGSAGLAKAQAGPRAIGAVAATDALIPFPDTVEVCAAAGCTVVAHTGGSVRDEDSVEAANRLGVTLVVTGVRHFRH
jgi:phosphoribosylaminoimidazolecarboxamide formyltransferase/IMP cyclohydrolase